MILSKAGFNASDSSIGVNGIMSSAPLLISLITGVWPTLSHFLPGFFATAIIFWPVTTITLFMI